MSVAEAPRAAQIAPAPSSHFFFHSLVNAFPPRVGIIALVLSIECLGVAQLPHPWVTFHQLMAAPIVFCAALLFFSRAKLQTIHNLSRLGINRRFALLHILTLTLIATESFWLDHRAAPPSITTHAAEALWYALILFLIFSLTATLFPPLRLGSALLNLRIGWVFALLTTIVAMSARTFSRWIWNAPDSHVGRALQSTTFAGVKALLGLFYSNIVSIPQLSILGTSKFKVQVAGTCSGIEGLALMLVFTLGWLIYARRELRLERAFLLIPITLAITWLLNLVRIATLIALGDAGHAAIALNGFHSEAGWIFFNAIALAFLLTVEHLSWLRRPPPSAFPTPALYDRNIAAPYLLPFLAVLATSLFTRASSSGFEALYPLRFAIALIVLWRYRAHYRLLNWSFGWLGPVAGTIVFVIWIALSHLSGSSAPADLATQLAHLSTWQRVPWITFRAASAIVTVPIVEELAFRGYLARRIQSVDIDSVPFAQLSVIAILLSSIAFGSLHGRMWIAAILSGIVFALVAKWRNRIGEAIAAHATANLFIALWVLIRSDYSLW